VDIFLWITRLLEMFLLHKRIGTYIIMMFKMVCVHLPIAFINHLLTLKMSTIEPPTVFFYYILLLS